MTTRYLNAQVFYIDSHNKTSGTHNDFWIDLKFDDRDVDRVCVQRAAIKKSYYIIQSGSNTFTLKEGASTALITVPEGNYSASSFIIVLAALLNTASPTHYTYAISIPDGQSAASTGKLTYTSTGSNSAFVLGTYLYEQLGFDSSQTVSFVAGSLTSANCVNFQVKSTLRIHSNMVSGGTNNILQEINTSGYDFSTMTYECQDVEANSRLFVRNGNSYRFFILDEDDQSINLSLNVLITVVVYKRNDILDQFCTAGLDYIRWRFLLAEN
jgi:hypothetical protein